jgi:SAM-dependent methyltransferase
VPTVVQEEFDGLTLVSDPADDAREDLVQGVTAAATTLAHLLVRRPVRSALDLGTGGGILALTLAGHAERVVATDVNPRALELARHSARLSGIANVEWRHGDWYAPVAGERFDLIVCNPPYVVSPETRLIFRDGSDATPGVVRAAADHLVPGGLAQFLVNWPHPPGDWAGPLRGWIPDGCDALAVHHASLLPRQYAETWADPHRVDVWLEWYREQGIEAIGAAFLLLRRRADDGPPRLQALEASTAPTPRAGLHVERLLSGADLVDRGDAGLLATPLTFADGVRVEQTTRRRGGAWQPGPATISCVPSVGVQAVVPAEHAAIVWDLGRADGETVATLRRLVELGFVVAGS